MKNISGGADCLLHDFRLFTGGESDAESLIIANREFGESFASNKIVEFQYFKLVESSVPGEPRYYFKQVRSLKSQGKYCDVSEALKNELHI